jgi:hypothetical protein
MNTSKSLLLALLVVLSFSANATVGIGPKMLKRSIELTKLDNGSILIHTNLFSFNKESFEIERSYDNRNFHTVAMVFAYEADDCFKPLQLKDKIAKNSKKVYYRVKKVENETASYILTKSIDVK